MVVDGSAFSEGLFVKELVILPIDSLAPVAGVCLSFLLGA